MISNIQSSKHVIKAGKNISAKNQNDFLKFVRDGILNASLKSIYLYVAKEIILNPVKCVSVVAIAAPTISSCKCQIKM
jgi:hypothetical protein